MLKQFLIVMLVGAQLLARVSPMWASGGAAGSGSSDFGEQEASRHVSLNAKMGETQGTVFNAFHFPYTQGLPLEPEALVTLRKATHLYFLNPGENPSVSFQQVLVSLREEAPFHNIRVLNFSTPGQYGVDFLPLFTEFTRYVPNVESVERCPLVLINAQYRQILEALSKLREIHIELPHEYIFPDDLRNVFYEAQQLFSPPSRIRVYLDINVGLRWSGLVQEVLSNVRIPLPYIRLHEYDDARQWLGVRESDPDLHLAVDQMEIQQLMAIAARMSPGYTIDCRSLPQELHPKLYRVVCHPERYVLGRREPGVQRIDVDPPLWNMGLREEHALLAQTLAWVEEDLVSQGRLDCEAEREAQTMSSDTPLLRLMLRAVLSEDTALRERLFQARGPDFLFFREAPSAPGQFPDPNDVVVSEVD